MDIGVYVICTLKGTSEVTWFSLTSLQMRKLRPGGDLGMILQ